MEVITTLKNCNYFIQNIAKLTEIAWIYTK